MEATETKTCNFSALQYMLVAQHMYDKVLPQQVLLWAHDGFSKLPRAEDASLMEPNGLVQPIDVVLSDKLDHEKRQQFMPSS
jgi:hypothetical protein